MGQQRGLRPVQGRILDFVRRFLEENGLPPTVRDIQRACGISSTSVVDYNLRRLQRDGYLRRRPDMARGLELLEGGKVAVRRPAAQRVPLMGYIAAGEPLPLVGSEGWAPEEPLESVDVPPELCQGRQDLYALKVKGSSMIDALVDDGDVVLVEPLRDAPDGAMVVARLKLQNETTLKRLYREGDTVRLQPANRQMEPIYCPAENVEVQGRVVGVIRAL
jgi:repressor LexA